MTKILTMKKFIIVIALSITNICLCQTSYEIQQQADKFKNYVLDYCSSFLSYPFYHSNTLKVHNGIKVLKEQSEKMLADKYTVLQESNYLQALVRFYEDIETQKLYIDAFEQIVGSIAGYSRTGIEAPIFETCIIPLFQELGWSIRQLPQKSQGIELYEYSKGSFVMLIMKNTLSPPNYSLNIYNDIEATLYTYWHEYRKEAPFFSCIIRGNKYRLIQYYDDSSPSYHRVSKVTSKRQ